MDFLSVLLTSLFAVIVLFFAAKLMGRRQISQLSLFDYINGITIGSIAAELATSLEEFWKPLTALVVFTLMQVVAALLTDKSPAARHFITGRPEVLFSDGCLYRDAFKSSRVGLDEFLSQMRVEGYSSLTDVRAALLEPNGRISFIPTAAKRPATNSDMNLTPEEDCYPTPLIMDGVVLKENFPAVGLDENWLDKNLKSQGINDARKVFYASTDGSSLTVFKIKT